MALVSYDLAVRHLRMQGVFTGSPEDPDLAAKIEQASQIVISHLKRPAEWDENSDPAADPEFAWVQAMTLKVLGHLYRFRGNDEEEPSLEDLFRKSGSSLYRDPTLA